ncbi:MULTISPECIES: hypothetical protein [unclassified Bradyrhizobium]|uniref:hypothetical protein n=1 Tax=unclassified Bradyrhizobium TaxID=2631580 RepID=UPI002FF0BD43
MIARIAEAHRTADGFQRSEVSQLQRESRASLRFATAVPSALDRKAARRAAASASSVDRCREDRRLRPLDEREVDAVEVDDQTTWIMGSRDMLQVAIAGKRSRTEMFVVLYSNGVPLRIKLRTLQRLTVERDCCPALRRHVSNLVCVRERD